MDIESAISGNIARQDVRQCDINDLATGPIPSASHARQQASGGKLRAALMFDDARGKGQRRSFWLSY